MSRNYWLHRINVELEISSSILPKNNILSIGFSDLSTKEFIDNRDKFDEYIKEEWEGRLPRNRYNLWRFLFEMKKGDYVVVPFWHEFSIYEIADDTCRAIEQIDKKELESWKNWDGTQQVILRDDGYLGLKENPSRWLDLGFFRKVIPVIEWALREDFADSALTQRMKIRRTNTDITDIKESVTKAIDLYTKEKPINLEKIIMGDIPNNVLSIITKELNPNKLENLVKKYLEKSGATEVQKPAKNEKNKAGDADVVATFEPIKTIIYVQVKFHEGETDEWALEQITNYRDYKKENEDDGYSKLAWVITTAEKFTDECYKKAEEENVQLINGEEFTQMILEVGLSNLGSI